MKTRYFFATLLLAFGIGQHAFAEEQMEPEAQQEVPQAPVMRESTEYPASSD